MDASRPKDVSDIAFAVYKLSQRFCGEAATEWSTVQQRLETIRKGLQPEAEFIAIANWLGRCVAIHRLDQTPLPKYNDLEDTRTPDLLAIVSWNGKFIPVLIEVKSTAEKQVLKWSEKYLTSLRRYAANLGFPLLVAWKWRNQWLLVEDRHFTKAVVGFHLPLEKAMQESLLDELFGDLRVELSTRIAFSIEAEVVGEIPPMPELIPEGTHTFKLKGARFILDGSPCQLSNELSTLFFGAEVEQEFRRTSGQNVQLEMTPIEKTFIRMSDLLLVQLLFFNFGANQESVDWEGMLSEKVGATGLGVRAALRDAVPMGVVRYVLSQKPETHPSFLAEDQ